MKNLTATALERRLSVLEMVYNGKSGHIGGSMGCMDILTVIYDVMMDVDKIKAGDPDRDRFVMSKGHCAEALYAVLADVGLIEREELKTYAKYNTRLAEHPTHSIPGVEAATGALGHGLSLAVGMAYGLKQSGSPAKVYTLMGDGEQAEGSVWEAAMSAAKFKLDNLTAVVDRNYLQISGGTEEVMPLDDRAGKYRAFGFHTVGAQGNNSDSLIEAFRTPHEGKPLAIIANTIKGYGSPIMENKADWHHLIPNTEQYEIIKADLTRKLQEVRNG